MEITGKGGVTIIDIVEALKNPEAYDEEVEKVEVKQTHISWVFLTGKYAYKVKKPVNFGFLDFTTLEKRKFYCEEEIRVNKPLCGDMYIEVVPINKNKGIKIKGEGETIEYAVKMKEFPQEKIMSFMLKKNEVKNEHIVEIARLLAEFHEKAKTGKGIDEYGSLKQVKFNWIQNFDQTREFKNIVFKKEKFDFIENKIMNFMLNNQRLFERRVEEGRVRECHGDVHSGNIFIVDKIYIFDAIEFNKAFKCSDVAAEIAFLAMDLEFHGRNDFSKLFVENYIELSKDEELLQLLEFYKCYRAYVRAKVTSFKLNQDISQKEKEQAKELARKYFDLAYEYARRL